MPIVNEGMGYSVLCVHYVKWKTEGPICIVHKKMGCSVCVKTGDCEVFVYHP